MRMYVCMMILPTTTRVIIPLFFVLFFSSCILLYMYSTLLLYQYIIISAPAGWHMGRFLLPCWNIIVQYLPRHSEIWYMYSIGLFFLL